MMIYIMRPNFKKIAIKGVPLKYTHIRGLLSPSISPEPPQRGPYIRFMAST